MELDCVNIAYGKTFGSTQAISIWGKRYLGIRSKIQLYLISDIERLQQGACNDTERAFDQDRCLQSVKCLKWYILRSRKYNQKAEIIIHACCWQKCLPQPYVTCCFHQHPEDATR